MTKFSYKDEIVFFTLTENIIGAYYNAEIYYNHRHTITLVLKGGHTFTPGWRMDRDVFDNFLSDIAVGNSNTYDVWY